MTFTQNKKLTPANRMTIIKWMNQDSIGVPTRKCFFLGGRGTLSLFQSMTSFQPYFLIMTVTATLMHFSVCLRVLAGFLYCTSDSHSHSCPGLQARPRWTRYGGVLVDLVSSSCYFRQSWKTWIKHQMYYSHFLIQQVSYLLY